MITSRRILLLSAPVLFALVPVIAQAGTVVTTPQTDAATPPGSASSTVPIGSAAGGAQDGAASPTQTGDSLQDIVVTATRRATNLQKVPATIDVASAAKLDALNIKNVAGLGALVPGVSVNKTGGFVPFIRGIGSNNSGYSETSVAFYVDGLYVPNSSGELFAFNNIDRIEVLKGPQGTLYGRNTTGGLINVITRAPTDTPTLDASVGYGSYNTTTANFYGSTALTSNLAVNLALYHQKQADGWGRNVFTGDDVLKSNETAAYGKLQWKSGPDTNVTLSGIFDYNNSDKGLVTTIVPGTYGTDGTPYLGRYRSSTRFDPSAPYHGYIGSLKVDQDLGFANFFILAGYQTSHQLQSFVQNGIPGKPVAGQSASIQIIHGRNKTFSTEIQLSSKPSASRLDWLVGAFYYHDNSQLVLDSAVTCVEGVCAPGTPTRNAGYPTTRSYSGYADGTYNLADSTRLTLGLRFTREEKGLTGIVTPLAGYPDSVSTLPASTVFYPGAPYAGNPNGIPTTTSFSKLTYRAVLAQDFGNDVHGYISYNRGFRSGTYNANAFTNPAVRPEVLDAYEAGLKSELFERRLRLNVSAFYYDYKDVQVRSAAGLPLGSPSLLQNAAALHARGIDAQFDFAPVHGLSITGGLEYLHSRFASFPGAACTKPRLPSGTVLGGLTSTACDLAGYPALVAPDFSVTLGAAYTVETDAGSFTLAANDGYKGRYNFTFDGTVQQSPHHLIDASLTWRSLGNRYNAQIFARNLLNQYYYAGGQASTTFVYTPGEPRTFGVQFGVHL